MCRLLNIVRNALITRIIDLGLTHGVQDPHFGLFDSADEGYSGSDNEALISKILPRRK